MKNKKMTYGLFVLVAGIWAYIVLQIIDWNNQEVVIQKATAVEPLNVAVQPGDSVVLLLNYRDPFLEKSRQKRKPVSKSTKSAQKIERKVAVEHIKWPEIKYNGSIRNAKTSANMAVLSINGREHLVSEGDQREEVHIRRIYPDSVLMAFMNDNKMIYK